MRIKKTIKMAVRMVLRATLSYQYYAFVQTSLHIISNAKEHKRFVIRKMYCVSLRKRLINQFLRYKTDTAANVIGFYTNFCYDINQPSANSVGFLF